MAWVAPVVMAVAGAASSYHNGKQQQKAANKLNAQQQPLIDAQTGLVKSLTPYASQFYGRALQGYDPAFAHYRAIASGDRSQIMGALAPDIENIGTKYRSLMQATGELMPRGGRSASFNAEIPFRAADDTQALISGARETGYANLLKMAGTAGDLGAGAAGVSTKSGEGANALLSSNYNFGRQNAADQAANQKDIANLLFAAWQAYSQARGTGGGG